MAIAELNYHGINRSITDFASARACEELINLRPTENGLIPAKEFEYRTSSLSINNQPVKKLFVHKTRGRINHIAVTKETNRLRFYLVTFGDPGYYTTSEIGDIGFAESTSTIADRLLEKLRFDAAGNIILFSLSSPDDVVFQNRAYLWDGTRYKRIDEFIPDISFDFVTPVAKTVVNYVGIEDSGVESIANAVAAKLNEMTEREDLLCTGPIVIAIAFKTKDGQTFWTGRWAYFDPTKVVNNYTGIPGYTMQGYSNYIRREDLPSEETWPSLYDVIYFNQYSYGYWVAKWGVGNVAVMLSGAEVSLLFDQISSSPWDNETSFISSIEIYSSRPAAYYDEDKIKTYTTRYMPEGGSESGIYKYNTIIPQLPYEELNIGGQLLYHQASVSLNSLSQSSQTVKLKFGGSVQTTNKTLDVDAGAVTRYGNILAYNARFHFYDSVAKSKIIAPEFYTMARGGAYYKGVHTQNSVTRNVFIRYFDGKEEKLLYVGYLSIPDDGFRVIVAQSQNVKQVILYDGNNNYVEIFDMEVSVRYNYSIHIGELNSFGSYTSEYATAMLSPSQDGIIKRRGIEGYIADYVWIRERDAINVTEQYSPFVFKVEHSYLAPGTVLDVQPQLVAVRDVTFGDYPLNVFTDRGVYALLQGNGQVLYSAWRPVSELVSISNSAPTDIGTFFLSSGDLWLMAGSKAVLVSEALHPGPHKYIRNNAGYKRISGGGSAQPIYDESGAVSQVTFHEYVYEEGEPIAKLSYNRYRDELIVSNELYGYSYVLSLKHRQWFKLDRQLYQDTVGGNVAITPSTDPGYTGYIAILDLEKELDDPVKVHLQTRPFSFHAYQYSHVHRIVAMIRARIDDGEHHLTVALYGSDNLQEWNLLSYAHRDASDASEGRTRLSQIRTGPAARSWRYYTVCIGGMCPTAIDCDFGPVLVDYEPVIRRLG